MGPNPTSDVSEGYLLRRAKELYQFDSSDIMDISGVKMVSDFNPIISRILDRLGPKFGFAISHRLTGLKQAKDLSALDRVYELLAKSYGIKPFYDLVFEHDARRLRKKLYHDDGRGFAKAMIDEFYRSILRHRNLGTVVLMPGWKASDDALAVRALISSTRNVQFVDAELRFRNLYD